MQCKTVLRSYKMTSDMGFAPNPYMGVLTLATCKPYIRKCRAIAGQWLAGFSSRKLSGDEVGNEKLIYLARIDDIIPMEHYWNAYPEKRNCPSADNIYRKHNGKWILVNNEIHKKYNKDDDLVGKNVLLSHDYYYFGRKALPISNDIRSEIQIPRTSTPYGYLTKGDKAEMFITWVKDKAYKMQPIANQVGMFGEPYGLVMPSKNSAHTHSCGYRKSSKKNS